MMVNDRYTHTATGKKKHQQAEKNLPLPCSDQSCALGGGVHLRSTLHLHRVTSLWEVLVTESGAFRTQV